MRGANSFAGNIPRKVQRPNAGVARTAASSQVKLTATATRLKNVAVAIVTSELGMAPRDIA